ncbi:hypothetical protein POVWA2_020480 [Plasmodium ovale wallikeri]|uniref:Uncharacterized protein n=1 Tax=Plasmodium ovale wallikeri TaxID=864142 RepID=A0A1A8YSS4_PLAOA|nr:hypothetical protein POVWA1_020300 [Plasmodium ovale wallikeri]SBT34559.1 hypothetical protein POVWA2_020480 [Plasmodium ovale wallikeri]
MWRNKWRTCGVTGLGDDALQQIKHFGDRSFLSVLRPHPGKTTFLFVITANLLRFEIPFPSALFLQKNVFYHMGDYVHLPGVKKKKKKNVRKVQSAEEHAHCHEDFTCLFVFPSTSSELQLSSAPRIKRRDNDVVAQN